MGAARRVLRVPFSYGGLTGLMRVVVEPMDDPVALGKTERERWLPACTAEVEFPGRGYWGLLGWVQLVSMGPPGHPPRWQADPFDLFEDSGSPYAWFGVRPTLFDAPSRRDERSLRWRARSFLSATPWDRAGRAVVALAGFEWGYDLEADTVTVVGPDSLPLEAFNGHTALLGTRYPSWTFEPAEG